jgi:glutamate-5-semialdehyde dehydrogenase
MHESVQSIAEQAREASHAMRSLTRATKDAALLNAARRLRDGRHGIQDANAKDLQAGRDKGMAAAMLDRLELTDARIDAMAAGLETVAALPDPVGDILDQRVHPNGLRIARVRQPLGVVAIIYESRPNVTADAAALCLKSGNACILRGGSEALHSNLAIADLFIAGCRAAGIPDHAVQIVRTPDRAAVGQLLRQDKYVDVIVPRGGKGLIQRIYDESRIPVIAHLDGVCHTYVDAHANLAMAKDICLNAKLQRPGVCNAMESMLVNETVAATFLPEIAGDLIAAGCELRGCPRTREIIACKEAAEEDWTTEYLDKILSIRVVPDFDEAVRHINHYGSHHSDAIVTDNYTLAERFLDEVDSATVYVNASTRFTDGYEFGLGAEIGISTNKLHVRGPMALEGLTSPKYIIRGAGQIRT